MSKHTPGPWKVGRVYQAGTGNFRSIFTAYDQNPGWVGPKHMGDFSGETPEEADANAHLIAAAPLMLDALKSAAVGIESFSNIMDKTSDDQLGSFLKSMRSTIAKAEGRGK